VIINEHLIEALRRLRRNASDNLVDRALVTNVLLNFLSRPREDPKRFEMLTVLANVLSWADTEREKAGLQRSNASGVMPGASSFWGRPLPSSGAKSAELAKTDETEVRFAHTRLVKKAHTDDLCSRFHAFGWNFC
jgi:hypothetical protein